MKLNIVDFTKKLIACPSVTPIEGGALNLLEETLAKMKFQCFRLPFSEEGYEDVDNLYARFGESEPNLCFAGHTDVVSPGNAADWTIHPFKPQIIDDHIIGRGAVDMKSAITAFICAVNDLFNENNINDIADLKGSISFLITGDEEGVAVNGTVKMVDWLQQEKQVITDCLVGEPTNPKFVGEMVKIGRRGSINFKITVNGTQGHVAYPHLAKNPCTVMVQLLNKLHELKLDNGNEYFQPSNLEIVTIDVGNVTKNIIPARASCAVNIRFNDEYSSDDLIKIIKNICAEEAEKNSTHIDINVKVSGEAFLTKESKISSAVIQAIKNITSKAPEISTSGGTSDARFIKKICPVAEFGLINETAHKVDEKIKISELTKLVDIYKETIRQYFNLG
ncbi:MAG: succinyl-diaminopimelate desuccinylase [Pseudomonadota bacterium]